MFIIYVKQIVDLYDETLTYENIAKWPSTCSDHVTVTWY